MEHALHESSWYFYKNAVKSPKRKKKKRKKKEKIMIEALEPVTIRCISIALHSFHPKQ